MSQNYGKLAQRYAKALLRAVESEQGEGGSPTPAQQAALSLRTFARLWDEVPELSNSMINPMFKQAERRAALVEVAARENLPDVAKRFLGLVFDRDRIAALPEIVEAFNRLADEAAGVQQVEVTVAKQLAEVESRGIESELAKRIGGRVEFSWTVDPLILGGMIVRFGGKVLDGSLGGRISRIERQLMN